MKAEPILLVIILLLFCRAASLSQQPHNALKQYISKADTLYSWKIENRLASTEGRFYELVLHSQRWQGIIWSHRLIIYFPGKALHPNTLLLVLRHIYNRNAALASLKYISDSTGAPSAFLFDMPNQPLFNGREEDDLQAYTFLKYIQTGDESWPLLFPMVKTVVRTIDAVQELALKEEKIGVSKIIVGGHSKRGHTSWLAAAVDSRIKGIIPIAIDVLNAPAQMPHHLKAFGGYSTPSQDATNFLHQLEKPLGRILIQMIDPYAYKESLALPKLIVCATNDDYFPTDALNLYFNGLKGNNSILYLSNAGHVGADSDPRVNPTAFAFVRAVATNKALPVLTWTFRTTKDSIQILVTTDSSSVRAVVWKVTSDSRDFRASQWYAEPMKMIFDGSRKQYLVSIPKPTVPNASVYGEVEFEQEGHRFLLSTQTYRYTKQ